MSLLFVRFLLVATGLLYLGLGLAFIFSTQAMIEKMPFSVNSPDGITEIRALYGGLELALGILFIYAGLLNRSLEFAILTMLITFAGLAFIRGVGVFIDGSRSSFTLWLLAIECFGVLYSLVAYGLWTDNNN